MSEEASSRGITLRSVVAGLGGVLLISLLTPYNNYVVNNTDLVGSFLPTSVVFLLFLIAVGNGIVHRFRPSMAFARGELTVALAMTLVACAFPAVGMMRYLPGHLVSPFYHAATVPEVKQAIEAANVSDWVFPTFETDSKDPAVRGNDPVVTDFVGRVRLDNPTFLTRLAAVPWSAWGRPTIAWGLFFGALFGAVICLTVIFREQWVVVERLPFPLVTVYASLIDPPDKGRSLNAVLRKPLFWIAMLSVLTIDMLYGLNRYFPGVPAINLSIDLRSLMAEPPLSYSEPFFKTQGIFFTIIGIAFFMHTKVAMSLWLLFVVIQGVRMMSGSSGIDITPGMEADQIFGATSVFACMMLWLARARLWLILQHMVRAPRGAENRGRYLSHRVAGWGLVACTIGAITWLWAAGASVIGATSIILLLLVLFLVLTKVIAETGLLYMIIPVPVNRPWIYAAQDLPGGARTSIGSYFWASMFTGMLTHDVRQTVGPYAANSLRLADDQPSITKRAGLFLLLLVLSMVVAYLASGAASLYIHYNYALTLDQAGRGLDEDNWGWFNMPRQIGLGNTIDYLPPNNGPTESHSRLGYFGLGAAITSVLSFLHLRFTAFPLHPIGFLLVYTWGLRVTWFSIFIGWLAKMLIVRFGGSRMLTDLRPLFLGLIVGEAVATAIWLLVSLILAHLGMEYQAIRLLPA